MTNKPIREMSDEELEDKRKKLDAEFAELFAELEESGGHSGSPGEWLSEEMDAVVTEQKRRSSPKGDGHDR